MVYAINTGLLTSICASAAVIAVSIAFDILFFAFLTSHVFQVRDHAYQLRVAQLLLVPWEA